MIHEQSFRLRHALNHVAKPLDTKASQLLDTELSRFVAKDADLLSKNTEYLTKHGESARHVQAALRVRHILDPGTAEENQKDLIRTLALESISLESAIEGLGVLDNWNAKSRFQDDYRAAAHERWPEATAFRK